MTLFHRYLGRSFNFRDALYLVFITLSLGAAWTQWHTFMDEYEQVILFATLPCLMVFGLFWLIAAGVRHHVDVLRARQTPVDYPKLKL